MQRPGAARLGAAIAGVAAVSGLAVVADRLMFGLLRKQGRLLLRIEELEEQVASLDRENAHLRSAQPDQSLDQSDNRLLDGLPIGTSVRDFDLPALDGRRVTLSEWRGRP